MYQVDAGCRRPLWVGQERKLETLETFFAWFGARRSRQLRFVCSDLGKPYLQVVAQRAQGAIHVLERFHGMAQLRKAIDELRANEARELAAAGDEPVLKNTRWLLLKLNLRTVRAYLLKEDFQLFWECRSPTQGRKFLDRWCRRAGRSRVEAMGKVAKMLRKHRALLLNGFRAGRALSSGALEGFNNKSKVTMRKAYG